MKIYARQIAPECQESPLFICDDCFPENINVFGNSRYNSHTSEVFDLVYNALVSGDLLDEWERIKDNGNGWYNSWKEALGDMLQPEGRGAYTREERKKTIPDILYKYYGASKREENSIICELMDIVTGKKWDYTVIRGCCQGEWQEVIYLADEWSRKALDAFETEYFNTGSEWIVHEEDTTPESPEDIEGFSVYCHGWSDDEIKAEILEAAGKEGDEVVLYKFAGYHQVPVYSLVG